LTAHQHRSSFTDIRTAPVDTNTATAQTNGYATCCRIGIATRRASAVVGWLWAKMADLPFSMPPAMHAKRLFELFH